MAMGADPLCRACGHEWQGELIGGLRSAGQYRCDRCGEARWVHVEDLERTGLMERRSIWDLNRREAKRVLGTCACGGSFDRKAPVRCPECHSDDVDVDRGPVMMVD